MTTYLNIFSKNNWTSINYYSFSVFYSVGFLVMPPKKNNSGSASNRHFETSQFSSSSATVASLDKESLEEIRLLFRAEIEEILGPLKKEIVSLKAQNAVLKNIAAAQQSTLERLEIDRRVCNLIVKGLPEASSDKSDSTQLASLLEVVRSHSETPPARFVVKSLRRVGKTDPSRPRMLIITLSCKEDKAMILKYAKHLKQHLLFGKVYFSPDLPELSRKENSRLFLAAKAAKVSNPGDAVFLRHGQLTVNGSVVDRFNIQNQLFLE